MKEFAEDKHGSVYIGITCRSLLEEFLRWLTERGTNIGASGSRAGLPAGWQDNEGSSRVAGGQAETEEQQSQGAGGGEVGAGEEDEGDEELEALLCDSDSEENKVEEAGSSSKKPCPLPLW